MKHVFGPVPSRRLGRSLGIDLVPFKTCSYDCIYCQLGRTTNKTIQRRQWISMDAVLDEIKEKLSSKPDYITLSGSGEPTLSTGLGALIEGIHALTDTPVAVLTNGSLLWQEEVRREIAGAQLIVPSLDAGDALLFEAVNRPAPKLSFDCMIEGLIALREEFSGMMWLEVFILGGYTAEVSEVNKINTWAKYIRPDRIQLNTATRPPAESFAIAVNQDRLEDLARLFEGKADVIADFLGVHGHTEFTATRETVLHLLERRPCSLDDIAEGLGIHRNEAVKYVEELLAKKEIESTRTENRTFYRALTAATRGGRERE